MSSAREWILANGGKIGNITIKSSPSAGNYVVATDKISRGELLVEIPRNLLVNVRTLHSTDSSHLALTKYVYEATNPWVSSFPSTIGLPLFWNSVSNLPEVYQVLVESQRAQVDEEFLESGLQNRQRFEWAWACVNSRCLYWDVGRDPKQQMTLAPFVDYLNHTPDQSKSVRVETKLGTMRVLAGCDASPGEEIMLNYGPHENGKLLCEYGFVVDNNPWEIIDITPEINAMLSVNIRSALADLGYAGNYNLDATGFSFRALVALAALHANSNQLHNIVGGRDDPERFIAPVLPLLQNLRQRYTTIEDDHASLQLMYRNYIQILDLVIATPELSSFPKPGP